jgi:uncharacterized protein YndB with AHSA1/START domain
MAVSRQEIEADKSAPGTVVVDRKIGAPVAQIWQALTHPDVVAQWFGTLSDPLINGQGARLDFGDGDFFTLQDIALNPPYHLKYAWRFLGIGPLDTINWHIEPMAVGCLVTVTDSEPGRTPEEALQLRKGWLDFTKRLKDFLAKGKPTRYAWRHDFDASIELTGSVQHIWETLFDAATQPRWLSLDGPLFENGARLMLTDGNEPSALELANLAWQRPTGVSFHLSHPKWAGATPCALELAPHNQGTILSVSQKNWRATGYNKEEQRRQRQRFSEFWIETLQRARSLIA